MALGDNNIVRIKGGPNACSPAAVTTMGPVTFALIEHRQRPLRRLPRPQRRVGDILVIAGRRDGSALRLSPIAALLWQALSDWTTEPELATLLEQLYRGVDSEERLTVLADAVTLFTKEELLEFARS